MEQRSLPLESLMSSKPVDPALPEVHPAHTDAAEVLAPVYTGEKPPIERGAVGNHTMIHLIHARVQTCAARRAGCTLAVVLSQSNTVFCQTVKVGCFHKWMTGNRQAISAELIQGDEQDIE